MTAKFDYDLLVIGGGSGGIASAKRAASLYKVKVGGKCHLFYRISKIDRVCVCELPHSYQVTHQKIVPFDSILSFHYSTLISH
jgi:hypothetical protein